MALTHALSTNNYGNPRLIVATSAANGTHTTLASAMADAVSGDTIALRNSVTENITLTPGVNIASWQGGSLNTPTITGTLTMTAAGTCNISGIRLATNSAALIAVTGSAASIVNLNNCYLNCTNATGITFSSSSASAAIIIKNCDGNLGTTGIAVFAHSSAGLMLMDHVAFSNTGLSSTASTCSSSGVLNMMYYNFSSPITSSGTCAGTFEHGLIDSNAQNVTSMTIGSGTLFSIKWGRFASGTASSVSIAGTAGMEFCAIFSSNTNAITGAGTLVYSNLSFDGVSNTVNVTTQAPLATGPKIYLPQGITFDNNVNTLSIFQQGTFNPTVVGFTTPGAPTMTLQAARYQKVGRIVTISMWVTWGALNGAVGGVTVNNLPYTVANQVSAFSPSSVNTNSVLALTANAVSYFQPNANAPTATILQYVGGATSSPALTNIAATNGFSATLIYETA